MTELYRKEIQRLKCMLGDKKSVLVVALPNGAYGSVSRVGENPGAILENTDRLLQGYKEGLGTLSAQQIRKKSKAEVVEIADILGIPTRKVIKKDLIDAILTQVRESSS